jgi:hypothetical protein
MLTIAYVIYERPSFAGLLLQIAWFLLVLLLTLIAVLAFFNLLSEWRGLPPAKRFSHFLVILFL